MAVPDKLDSIDKKLLELLSVDAQQNSDQLAQMLGVSSSTVRRRIRLLIKSGILSIVGITKVHHTGSVVNVLIGLDIALDKLTGATAKLAKLPGVQWVVSTTGRYDLMVLVRFRSHDELDHFLQTELFNVDGLKDSETFLCLSLTRGSKRQFLNGAIS